jgi:hypothetical protein
MTPNEATFLLEKTKFKEEIQQLILINLESIKNTEQHQYEDREDYFRKIKVLEEILAHFESLSITERIKKRKFFLT